MVLLPTSPAIADACATELDQTYCSEGEAAAAAAQCTKALSDDAQGGCTGDGCVTLYDATRNECHAGPTYPTPETCATPVEDDCSFYRACLEAQHPCGADGYALSFGERYCYSFIRDRTKFSAAGQRWLRRIRTCLQEALVPMLGSDRTCDAVMDDAYASHVGCYTEKDNSFCLLAAGDVLALTNVISDDLFSGRTLKQIHDVAKICAEEGLGVRSAGAPPSTTRAAFFRALADATSDRATLRAFLEERGARK